MDLADEAREVIEKTGANATVHDSVAAGEEELQALISRLKRGGIEVLHCGSYDTEAARIVRHSGSRCEHVRL